MNKNPYLQHIRKDSKSPVSLHKNPQKTVFGNYSSYYGYRNTKSTEIDPRLQILPPLIFNGQRILDIGCNSGNISLEIARHFNPSAVTGVDIDPALIQTARYNLSKFKSLDYKDKEGLMLNYFPMAGIRQYGLLSDSKLYENVKFRCSDWVHEPLDQVEYDVILALSVSKWIHLNFGDGAIRHFFAKVHSSLRSGGLFVFEPQPSDGYRKRAGMNERMKRNYEEMEFYPEDFADYLQKKVGFKLEMVLEPTEGPRGFSRAVYLFRKR